MGTGRLTGRPNGMDNKCYTYQNELYNPSSLVSLPQEVRMKLQERATVNRYCPVCNPDPPKLIVRTNRQNDSQFLGCPNYPECNHTESIPEHIYMEAAGASKLPGF